MIRPAIVLITALFAAVTTLAAHEGHTHKAMGTTTMVSERQLAVKDEKGQTLTFTLDGHTKISRGRNVLTLSDIKVGDRVVVTYAELKNKAGKVTRSVKSVQLGVTPATTTKSSR